jgi:hypothetical protein
MRGIARFAVVLAGVAVPTVLIGAPAKAAELRRRCELRSLTGGSGGERAGAHCVPARFCRKG